MRAGLCSEALPLPPPQHNPAPAGDRFLEEEEEVERCRKLLDQSLVVPRLPLLQQPGAQFSSFVEISTDFSTDFSTEFLVLQGVPRYYKNSVDKSVEKSVEISTKLLN